METLKVYKYDKDFYFWYEIKLDNTDKDLAGNWLIPGNCTQLEPLVAKEGCKVKYNKDKNIWEYEEIPKEPQPPEPTLEELKLAKLAEVNRWTEQNIIGGFTSSCTGSTVKYDSDKDTQLTMQGIALNVDTPLFAEKYPKGCPVRGYALGETKKTIFFLSPKQVMQWQADLSMHIGTCKQAGWQKQAEVDKAQSKENLKAIALE